MASVSRCDRCGKITEHKDCHYLKMYEENPSGKIGKLVATVEICSSCAELFLETYSKYGSK